MANFWELAQQYHQAYRTLPPQPYPIYWPPYLLLGHAVEMALKAFLLSRGIPLARIKTGGHDLKRLRKMAAAKGLELTDATARMIDKPIAHMHGNLLARYPDYAGAMRNGVIVISECEAAVDELMRQVRMAMF